MHTECAPDAESRKYLYVLKHTYICVKIHIQIYRCVHYHYIYTHTEGVPDDESRNIRVCVKTHIHMC